MGLAHSIDTELGIPATYFNLQSAFKYYRDGCIDVNVNGYISQDARLDGARPIYAKAFRIEINPDSTQTDIYNHLKTLEPFIGATDQ